MLQKVEEVLAKQQIKVLKNEPMSGHTSFQIGGPCDLYVTPADEKEIKSILKAAKEEQIPLTVFGKGSNVLVSDKGIRGIVMDLSENYSGIQVEGNRMIVQSGATLAKIAAAALKESLAGFEFASGIPGTLGGAVMMNAGAYGGEMKDVIVSTRYLKNGQIHELHGLEHEFAYRTSYFKKNPGCVILTSVIELERGNAEEIRAKMMELNTRRKDKQPLEYPSAGSTFQRPEGFFAGTLIEQSGLKGVQMGGAAVSEKHAGFVINKGGATAEDVRALIAHIKETVYQKHGVRLQEEVIYIGEF